MTTVQDIVGAFPVREIPATVWAIDLLKENSTSGTVHVLSKTRNSLLPLGELEGTTLRLSVENMSEMVCAFRGQSKDEGIQFQLPLGGNEIRYVYLPFATDYMLSTDQNIKISAVSVFNSSALSPQDYDFVKSPSNLIQVVSASYTQFDRGLGYKLTGLANIYFKQKLAKEDIVEISSSGRDVVWRINELRIRSSYSLSYVVPATEVPPTISCGAEKQYHTFFATYQRKYINPAYVAPEAQLWSLENLTR